MSSEEIKPGDIVMLKGDRLNTGRPVHMVVEHIQENEKVGRKAHCAWMKGSEICFSEIVLVALEKVDQR